MTTAMSTFKVTKIEPTKKHASVTTTATTTANTNFWIISFLSGKNALNKIYYTANELVKPV